MSAQPTGSRHVLRALILSGAGAVALHPLRSLVTVACVVAIVLPYLVGLGVSDGLRTELTAAVAAGPDLHVSATRFGRPTPFPRSAVATLRALPGVQDVVPRVVGEIDLGAQRIPAVVVGLPAEHLPRDVSLVEGRMYTDDGGQELVIGAALAQRLGLRVGDPIPPFYRNDEGERVSTVVGVFHADGPLWQAHMLLVSLSTAQSIFAEGDTLTDCLVRCPPAMREPLAERIRGLATLGSAADAPLRPRAVTRDDVDALLLRRVLDRQTLFQTPFVLAFVIGIPLVLVTSGVGLVERRREAGLLRALGWGADQLLLRALVESVLLAVTACGLSVLLAYVWMRWLNAAGIAPVLFPGAGRIPDFRVPWSLGATPVLLAVAVCTVLVGVGTLYSTWRAASASAAEAMQ